LDPENWAVLEVGEAALIFARDGHTGYFALTVGATEAALHPRTVSLVDGGLTEVPIKASLRWQGNRVSLEVDGQRIDLPAPAPQELTVAVSSGRKTPWSLEHLSIILAIDEQDLPPGFSEGDDSEAAARASGLVSLSSANGAAGTDAATSNTGGRTHRAKAIPADYRPLEIYTPPSVRTKRAEQIKAAVKALRHR
jgi:hypothetical protein